MLNWLLEPLQYSFILRAFTAAVIVGMVCSVLGTYVVLRGMAFFGDALAHTILPGVVIAFLIGWPLAVGALIFGILTALGIGLLTDRGMLKEDTAIGVVFAGLFALGVAMLSATGNYTVHAIKTFEIDAPFPVYVSGETEAFFCDGKTPVAAPTLFLYDAMVEKPAVYIYPEEPGPFTVVLDLNHGSRLTASSPSPRIRPRSARP